jgi:hypothetical protein
LASRHDGRAVTITSQKKLRSGHDRATRQPVSRDESASVQTRGDGLDFWRGFAVSLLIAGTFWLVIGVVVGRALGIL